MSDLDTSNPVVEPDVKEEVSILAEDTTPSPDVQPPSEEVVDTKPSPLEPGGDRFKQVWARAKQAEARAAELETERQREREERIRLEERLKVKEETVKAQPTYTEEQLEQGIDEGKWTRAQANEYRKQVLRTELKREFEHEKIRESTVSKIIGEIETYKSVLPDVMQYGSESRTKVENEYAYMVRTLGMPDNQATQLAALRSAFGDVESLKRKTAAKQTITNKEPFMETHSPQNSKTTTKDFASTLSPEKKTHYEKMLRAGVYKDWAEIEAEEKWTPKTVRVRR